MKYLEKAVVFSEYPDEICLALSITNCPNNCAHCSEPWLKEDAGKILDEVELKKLINENPGITMVGFSGGDNFHSEIAKLSEVVHQQGLKVGMYSGQDYLDMDLLNCLDYYKIGHWIRPEGNVEDWWKTNCGPLKFTFSNQVMFKREGNRWINITSRFREKQLNNLQREIIK